MKVAIFGATGSLGGACVAQCLDAGHEVSVLARSPDRLADDVSQAVRVVEGDGLDPEAVRTTLAGTEGVLFAIGVDKRSPEDLCTDVTRHILAGMETEGVRRLVWCGGGSTIVAADTVTVGSRFVVWFSRTFLGLRHRDKAHQMVLLDARRDLEWVGVRPLQMRSGPRQGDYRMGFDRFSGLSRISFADCAHAMIRSLTDDRWLHQAPIIQY